MGGGESPRFAEFCISCECRTGSLAQFFPYFPCRLILMMVQCGEILSDIEFLMSYPCMEDGGVDRTVIDCQQ